MLLRALALAGLVVASTGVLGLAQELRGPRELPPSSFTGAQYVDSRGCVFLRAGLDGRVNWVPRVSRDRRQLCGYPPSFTPEPTVAVAAAPAPAEAKAAPQKAAAGTVAAPRKTAPAAVARTPAPLTVEVPPPAAAPRAGRRLVGCPVEAPSARRYALKGGGSVVLCVPTGGDLDLAQAPVVPKGYRLAWSDDRLNPLRGVGTAAGQAAQDQVWTRKVPAELVASTKKTRAVTVATADTATVTTSTSTAPKSKRAKAGQYVQVGSFGVPGNAARAQARLASLGLPVAATRGTIGGQAVQVVLAGPFASAAEAAIALRAARGAGFADAFLR